ncbi:MAG: DUF501 domain-containing protein [Spirochaetales bacterium]|nr:MAG: DUF501 domain-containing protein [Spirochaetales bacterium]
MVDYSCSDEDIDVIRRQIGRKKIYADGIVERCEYGYPRIMLLNPDAGGGEWNYEAVSNVLWLTCPYLNERIHGLEQSGYLEKIGILIRQDNSLKMKMENAHAQMFYLRKRVCHPLHGETFPFEMRRVMDAGVGGARDTSSLKCLHAHFCHYRVCENNVAGLVTARLLDDRLNCEEVRCRNAI